MSNRIEKRDSFKFFTKKEKDEGYEGPLSAIVKRVVKQVEPIFGRISVIFEEYTLHDISHSENVLIRAFSYDEKTEKFVIVNVTKRVSKLPDEKRKLFMTELNQLRTTEADSARKVIA